MSDRRIGGIGPSAKALAELQSENRDLRSQLESLQRENERLEKENDELNRENAGLRLRLIRPGAITPEMRERIESFLMYPPDTAEGRAYGGEAILRDLLGEQG